MFWRICLPKRSQNAQRTAIHSQPPHVSAIGYGVLPPQVNVSIQSNHCRFCAHSTLFNANVWKKETFFCTFCRRLGRWSKRFRFFLHLKLNVSTLKGLLVYLGSFITFRPSKSVLDPRSTKRTSQVGFCQTYGFLNQTPRLLWAPFDGKKRSPRHIPREEKTDLPNVKGEFKWAIKATFAHLCATLTRDKCLPLPAVKGESSGDKGRFCHAFNPYLWRASKVYFISICTPIKGVLKYVWDSGQSCDKSAAKLCLWS